MRRIFRVVVLLLDSQSSLTTRLKWAVGEENGLEMGSTPSIHCCLAQTH